MGYLSSGYGAGGDPRWAALPAPRIAGLAEPAAPFDVIGGFAFDRAELGPPQKAKMADLARHLIAFNIRSVRLVGHTDPVGSPQYNKGLGQRRAEMVRGALIAALESRSPGSSRSVAITVDSAGETRPIPGGAPSAHRRVEVFLITPPPPPPPPPRPQAPPPRPYTGPTMGPAPSGLPPPPECPPDYICRGTREFLLDQQRRNGTITKQDANRAVDIEHGLLRRHRRAPMVVDPHQSEDYWKWVSTMRQEARRRVRKFAETNWMPFPD